MSELFVIGSAASGNNPPMQGGTRMAFARYARIAKGPIVEAPFNAN